MSKTAAESRGTETNAKAYYDDFAGWYERERGRDWRIQHVVRNERRTHECERLRTGNPERQVGVRGVARTRSSPLRRVSLRRSICSRAAWAYLRLAPK